MSRLLSFFVFFFFAAIQFSFGQLNVNFSTATPNPNETIEIDVSVSDFVEIELFQFGIGWDSTVASFVSITNVTNQLAQFSEANNIGTPTNAALIDDGELSLSWSLNSTEPVSLPDGTVLFTIVVDIVGEACDETSFMVTPPPIGGNIEVFINNLSTNIGATSSGGLISIPGDNCGGGGNDGVGLIGSMEMGDMGSQVCVEVTTENFTNIASIQTGIVWDETLINYVSVQDGALTGISLNENETANGELKLLWLIGLGEDPVTLNDGTVLFEICFDLIGAEGQMSDVSFVDLPNFNIEVADGDGISVDYFIVNGKITIGDGVVEVCDTGVGLLGDSLNAFGLTSVCVPVRSKDFINIASVQTGIVWDENVIGYTGVNDGAMTGISVNDNESDNGELKLLWIIGLGDDPVTVDDGTVLFELCYDIVGSEGESSDISFVDLPNFNIEIANGDGISEDYCTITGFVDLSQDDNPPVETCDTGVGIIGDSLSTNGVANICVPVTSKDFINIASVQTGIVWDETVLDLTDVNDGAMTSISVNAINASMGELKLLWIIGLGDDPVTVPDGTVLFELCFDVLGAQGSSSSISFVDLPNFDIEVANGEGMAEEYCTITGFVEVTGEGGGETCDTGVGLIGDSLSTNGVSNICVPVTSKDFTNIASVQTGIVWDETVIDLTEVNDGAMTGISVNALNAGMGELKLLWIIGLGDDPVTVPDGTVLFELCFDVLGAEGTSSSISFVDLPNFDIEIANGEGMSEEYCTITGFVEVTGEGGGETCDTGVGLIGDSLSTNGVSNICVPVTSKDFTNIASVQTGIVWDETVIDLTEVNDGAMTGISVNALNAGMGELKLLWIIGLGDDPVTVPDGTVLFELCFDVLGAEGSSSSISFVDLPNFDIEIANGEGMSEEYCTITGFVDVTEEGGVETCDTGVGLIGDSLSTNGVTNICVPVTSKDFTNIASVQTGIVWDETVIDLTGVNDGAMTGISVNALNAGMGELKLLWIIGLGDDPVTVPDGTVLFELCFDVLGAEGSSSSISFVDLPNFDIEIANGEGMSEEYCTITGFVDVTEEGGGETCDTGVGLIGDSLSTNGVTNICVPVTSKDFTNIESVQTGVVWDETVIDLTGVNDGAMTGISLNALNAGMGELKLLWIIGLGDDPVTVPDGTVLFEICYDVIGAEGESSSISFVDLPEFNIEIASEGESVEYCTITGFLEITPGSEDNCEIGVGLIGDTLTIDKTMTNNFCMPITTENFINIASIQTGIQWDPTVIDFTGVNEVNLTSTSLNTANAANGDIRLLWIIGLGDDPVTLNDGEVLFEICFDAIGDDGSMSDVSFVDLENFDVEIANGEGQAEPVCLIPGKVTIQEIIPATDFSLIANHVTGEQGTNVCVDVDVTGFSEIQSTQFTIMWDASVLSFGTVEMLNPGICMLTQNNFFQPLGSDDKLRVSWSCANGSTVEDSSLFFKVCFDIIGECNPVSSTVIEFVDDDPILIEITDVDNNEIDPVLLESGSVTVIECPEEFMCALGDVVHVDCTGDETGSISVGFTGAVGTVSCSWTGPGGPYNDCDLQGIGAGTYTLTATDENGSSCTLEVEITEPDEALSLDGETTAAICGEGGSVDVTVTGGTGDKTFNWNPDQGNVEDLTNVGPGEYCLTVTDENNCTADMCFIVGNSAPTLSISTTTTTNISCNSLGGVDISIEGGCTPIVYNWTFNGRPISTDQDISELKEEGTYTVVVTDNSDPIQEVSMDYVLTSTVTELTVAGQPDDLLCNGDMNGTIDLTVEGGCPSYTFMWDNGETTEDLTGLSAGTYCVTVDDQFCPGDDPIVMCFDIDEPPPLTIDLIGISHVTNLEGNNGVIDIEPRGGVSPYTFNWSPNGSMSEDQINMAPGEYCVTVTDANDCTAEACYTIEWAAIFLDNCLATPSGCAGECTGEINCDIVGGCGGVEIRVNDILVESFPLTELCSGTYNIQITDACGNTDSEMIVLPETNDLFIDTLNVLCSNPGQNSGSIEIEIVGGTSPFEITWGGATQCDGSEFCDELSVGFYTIVVVDGAGCQAILQNIEIAECVPPPDGCFDNARPIITPNGDGFNDQFLIQCADGSIDANLSVYDRWGRLVYEQSNYDNTWEGTSSSGSMLDDGGYMWVLEVSLANGDTILKNGSLTILRNNF